MYNIREQLTKQALMSRLNKNACNRCTVVYLANWPNFVTIADIEEIKRNCPLMKNLAFHP